MLLHPIKIFNCQQNTSAGAVREVRPWCSGQLIHPIPLYCRWLRLNQHRMTLSRRKDSISTSTHYIHCCRYSRIIDAIQAQSTLDVEIRERNSMKSILLTSRSSPQYIHSIPRSRQHYGPTDWGVGIDDRWVTRFKGLRILQRFKDSFERSLTIRVRLWGFEGLRIALRVREFKDCSTIWEQLRGFAGRCEGYIHATYAGLRRWT
jgi:hypothetical protein